MEWENNNYLYQKIQEFQEENPTFPIEPITNFCKDHKINLIGYTQNNNFCMNKSKDGFTFFDNGEYTIFYNINMPIQRKRFTIAHELGHIYLQHHKLLNTKRLSKGNSNQIWEHQANVFAHNALLPATLAKTLNSYNHVEIAKQFNLSISMVNFRYSKLKEDIYYLQKYRLKNV